MTATILQFPVTQKYKPQNLDRQERYEASRKIIDLLMECYSIGDRAGLDINRISVMCAAIEQRLEELKVKYPDTH